MLKYGSNCFQLIYHIENGKVKFEDIALWDTALQTVYILLYAGFHRKQKLYIVRTYYISKDCDSSMLSEQ